ncbi:dTMP kinase [Streptomyces sp. NPDC021020]|uniref:dTMP kinase n=1 Tax=Streptomyces sp. NPDC021020 TaxID=3365109 RepID=UPI0037A3EFE5
MTGIQDSCTSTGPRRSAWPRPDRPEPAEPARPPGPPDFTVLIGGDFAGKSTVLGALAAAHPEVQVLSTDEGFLGPRHLQVGQLRRLAGRLLPHVGGDYTPDFLAALFHAAVVHLRDELRRCDPGRPVVMDSYYYKFLAKCRLAGAQESPLFAWWRSYPQPHRVIELEVPPATAWERCGRGAGLNALEFYGASPVRPAFEDYQSDLRRLMREEVRHLPLRRLPATGDPSVTAHRIQEALADVRA